jgi:hypothetical protein
VESKLVSQAEVDTPVGCLREQKCESRHREERNEEISLQPWIRMTQVGEDEGNLFEDKCYLGVTVMRNDIL